jgi:hypothetical protein
VKPTPSFPIVVATTLGEPRPGDLIVMRRERPCLWDLSAGDSVELTTDATKRRDHNR